MILFLESKQLRIQALSQFIAKGRHYALLLENDPKESILRYEHNTNLTVRQLIRDDQMFTSVVEKVVDYNENNMQDEGFNVMLLDKIGKQDRVLQYLIKLQTEEIERKMPQYFLKVDVTREDFTIHLVENKTYIELVSKIHAPILNQYEKAGLKKTYPQLYSIMQVLDTIGNAFNKVWDQRYEEAITEFSMLDLLPLKKDSNPTVKGKIFTSGDSIVTLPLQHLLLNSIMTLGKLIKHIHYKVSNETLRFQDTSKAAETKYKQLEDYKEVLSRLVLYLDIIQAEGGRRTMDLAERVETVARECKRI